MSHNKCQVSVVIFSSFFLFLLIHKVVGLVGGGSVVNGAYPFLFIYIYIVPRVITNTKIQSNILGLSHSPPQNLEVGPRSE